MNLYLFPKPGKKPPVAIRTLRDGKEQCNLLTKQGRDEYMRRKRVMWERQGRMCCLYSHIASCPGKLNWADSTFDHEIARGLGGGARDDRIEIEVRQPDGTIKIHWQNGAAHAYCNVAKGSRRINYNTAHNIA